jgi:siroheme synthase
MRIAIVDESPTRAAVIRAGLASLDDCELFVLTERLGLSLTLRGMARKSTLVTAHARAGEPLDLDWHGLTDPGATLAVYMGKAAAGEVSVRSPFRSMPRPDGEVAAGAGKGNRTPLASLEG